MLCVFGHNCKLLSVQCCAVRCCAVHAVRAIRVLCSAVLGVLCMLCMLCVHCVLCELCWLLGWLISLTCDTMYVEDVPLELMHGGVSQRTFG